MVANVSVHCAAFSEPTLKEKYVPRRRGNLKKLKRPYSSPFEYRTKTWLAYWYTLRLHRECNTASNLCFYKLHMREFCIFMRAEDWIVFHFMLNFYILFYIIHKLKRKMVVIIFKSWRIWANFVTRCWCYSRISVSGFLAFAATDFCSACECTV